MIGLTARFTASPPSVASREALAEGCRAGLTLAVGYIPFALAMGATFAATDIAPAVSWSSSWLLFAGAAQIAAVAMLDTGTAPAIVIASGLIINSRHLLYGASLAPFMAGWPRRWRWALAYLLADPVFALVIARFEGRAEDASRRRSYYLGVGVSAWTAWQVLTAVGLVMGGALPESLPLGLATPLTFLLLLVPTIKNRPTGAAAGVGAVTAVIAGGLPLGLGLLAGAVTGITAGVLVASRSADDTTPRQGDGHA